MIAQIVISGWRLVVLCSAWTIVVFIIGYLLGKADKSKVHAKQFEEGMKAFEEWFNEEPTENEKGYCMVAWKAALEWASNEPESQRPADKIVDNKTQAMEG